MFEIKLTIEMPDLVRVAEMLAGAAKEETIRRGNELGALLDVLKPDKIIQKFCNITSQVQSLQTRAKSDFLTLNSPL